MKNFYLGLLILLTASCIGPTGQHFTDVNMFTSTGRYNLVMPAAYGSLISRAEKFFTLIVDDESVLKMKFQMTKQDPANIIATIRASDNYPVKVTTYGWFKDKYSKAVARYMDGEIQLNKYKLNRHPCKILNTLVHEKLHHLGYSHGDNDSVGKDDTVPYWFGDKAEAYCMAGKI